jgi:hypothetical protein
MYPTVRISMFEEMGTYRSVGYIINVQHFQTTVSKVV